MPDAQRAAAHRPANSPSRPSSNPSMKTARNAHRALSLIILAGLLSAALLAAAARTASAQAPPLFPGQNARIALDPGHGGKDVGARGPTGLLEKDVCLTLARNLVLRLESRYSVILTRSDDYQAELYQRTAIANQAAADLLVSLHTGGGYVHANRGIDIYYYADAGRSSPMDDTDRLIPADDPQQWSRTQQRHQSASLALATALKKKIDQVPDAPGCSIRGAPLAVLEGADMPAVLIEIGQITHPATEASLAALKDGGWLAGAIIDGIQDFLKEREGPSGF
jgi:N-acetylmuramoyl-L-alanine amidase